MNDFIQRNVGQREPGIIIGSRESLITISDLLLGKGFESVTKPMSFVVAIQKGGNYFLPLDQVAGEERGSFFEIVQELASGSVDVEGVHIDPPYQHLNIVIVASDEFITEEEHHRRAWATLCGMAYQYSE